MNKVQMLTLAIIAATAAPIAAQSPSYAGTATGLGGTGVIDARRADALSWNPALVGVFDGPLSSYSLLAVDVRALPGSGWKEPAQRLGIDGIGSALRGGERSSPAGGGGYAAGRVEWLSSQFRDFAVGVASQHVAAANIPAEIGAALGAAGPVVGPTAADSAMRSTFTVLTAGRGVYVGRMPVLGAVWLGAAAKGVWVHSHARGSFQAAQPGEDVYREAVLRDIPAYGFDVGGVVQPMERVRIGASVSNVFSGAFRPGKGARVRVVSVVERGDSTFGVSQTETPHLGPADVGTDEARAADNLWNATGFPSVARAGVSFESDLGSFSAAARVELMKGGLDPEWEASPLTVAFAGAAGFPVRVSYGWGASAREVSAAFAAGGCRRRWIAGVTRRSAGWGSSFGFALSTTIGSAAGCDIFHG